MFLNCPFKISIYLFAEFFSGSRSRRPRQRDENPRDLRGSWNTVVSRKYRVKFPSATQPRPSFQCFSLLQTFGRSRHRFRQFEMRFIEATDITVDFKMSASQGPSTVCPSSQGRLCWSGAMFSRKYRPPANWIHDVISDLWKKNCKSYQQQIS